MRTYTRDRPVTFPRNVHPQLDFIYRLQASLPDGRLTHRLTFYILQRLQVVDAAEFLLQCGLYSEPFPTNKPSSCGEHSPRCDAGFSEYEEGRWGVW